MEFTVRDDTTDDDRKLHRGIMVSGSRRFRRSPAYEALIQQAMQTLKLTEEEARQLYG